KMNTINQQLHTTDDIRLPLAPRPRTIEETGLSFDFIAKLICKHLHVNGTADLHQLCEKIALSGNILESVLDGLRKQNLVEILAASHASKGLRYALTDKGLAEALVALSKSGYTGPAPVPIEQYRTAVKAQSIQNCKIIRPDVQKAFQDTTVDPQLLDQLGPAMHSGRAIMIYGLPGTGKTFICKRLSRLLGQTILIPYAISVGESTIQIFDPVIHIPVKENTDSPNYHLQQGSDPRFIECLRPVAISGGELTLDMLEIDHDKNTRLSQAPLQLKANNGMYIIDDLGRQRVPPVDLFNRWIVPLEEKHDYLSLDTGKRVQMPFDVILIFSANINPMELADEAFLRRLGYKIRFAPVNKTQYVEIWHLYVRELQLSCPDSLLDEIFERYKKEHRPLLPCHPRDLLGIVRDQCQYEGDALVATPERLNIAWDTYFINLENARIDS
ncbi:MAG: AAA family ATPase, partial [Gammaproteobacteria bacterium]